MTSFDAESRRAWRRWLRGLKGSTGQGGRFGMLLLMKVSLILKLLAPGALVAQASPADAGSSSRHFSLSASPG